MKTFLISTAILVTFLGCSHNNAFDRFEMSKTRELSEENIQSAKITQGDEVGGVVTAVYLNKIYPHLYKDAEYFYIYLNLQEKTQETQFILNNLPSLLVEELNSTNEYTELTLFDAEWKRYYLVGFKEGKGNLKLHVKNGEYSSSVLTFKKN